MISRCNVRAVLSILLVLPALLPTEARAAGLAVDAVVSTHQSSAAKTIISPGLTTTGSNELLVAFIASDGPSSGKQTISSVTASGLTWRLRQRTNTQLGTAEIWSAVAASALTSVSVTATRASGSYTGAITVVAFSGANTTVDGATATASASSGAPSATLKTTIAGSWVWAVGDDWDSAIARAVGSGQTKVDEYLASSGDTYWTQRETSATPTSGTTVTINDTAPTGDRWNLSLIEIPPASADLVPPTPPSNLSGMANGPTQVSLTWGAATDNVGVVGYNVLRGGVQIGTATGLSYTDNTVVGNATYSYTVTAQDAAGNVSQPSNAFVVTTPAPADNVPPTVSLTSPLPNAVVSGTVSVQASASDNVAVASVQFTLDGTNLGVLLTTAPYALSWDSTTVPDGPHTLSAIAKDTSGNIGTATPVAISVANSSLPAQIGQWGSVITWPEVSIHAALTPTGKVLTWQGDFSQGGQQYIYDPIAQTIVQVPSAAVDLFCAGQAVTADGRILVLGGTATNGGLGIPDVTAFDWHTQTWASLHPMNYARWYATGTTLADGTVLVNSGYNNAGTISATPEFYDVPSNTWTALPAATHSMPIYPFMYQLPDGRVLHAGGSEVATDTEILDLKTLSWSTVDARVIDGASIVNYAPWKFMKAGSASDDGLTGASLNTAYTLDMTQPSPIWQPTSSMAFARSFVNLTPLPDGTVLATGGGTDRSGDIDSNAVLPAEQWNPATGLWRTLAAMSVPRLYHSVAVLLPDGRVFVSGSGGSGVVTNQYSAQIYSPWYLFNGARPTIASVPSTLPYNSPVFVQTPDAASIASVRLIRTGSVTHSFDQNSRSVPLAFAQATGGLTIQTPPDGNTAPPGYYLLFIVNAQGVPSVGAFVRFAAPYEDGIPPSAPGTLTASGGAGTASLGWGAATDNVGVTAYNVYRSTTSGFTPNAANLVATVGGTALTYTDSGLVAGTYYYLVTAEDAGGNIGPPSNQASATVTSVSVPLAVDATVTTHQSGASTTIVSPALTTTTANDVIIAFVTSDGPVPGTQTFSGVTGGGLTWRLRQRTNGQAGTAEIWEAVATATLSGVTITASRSSGSYGGSITVVAFRGASTTVDGATGTGSATTGAPSATLTTTHAGSWVWAVGNDWDNAIARTVGSGQTKVDEYLAPSGDTFWVQRQTNVTASADTLVTINDTAPTSDRWNLSLIEILPR